MTRSITSKKRNDKQSTMEFSCILTSYSATVSHSTLCYTRAVNESNETNTYHN